MPSLDPSKAPAGQRRLAAILAGDIKGFSHLVGVDEENTIARVTHQLAHLADPLVKEHNGRIFKTTGDGFLAIFNSSLEAVRCAIAFQSGAARQNADLLSTQRLEYRIGINLGDVIATADDFYGDSVNIAARLQTAAQPGGICISASVYDQIKNKLSCQCISLGQEKFKNIADPVSVYRIVMTPLAATATGRVRWRKPALAACIALAAIAVGLLAWANRPAWQPTAAATAVSSSSVGPQSEASAAEARQDAVFKRMLASMQSDKFSWRTIERLALETGVSENEAHEILAAHPREVVLGKSRDGKLLARLSEH